MLKKLAPSFLLASTLVGTLVAPSMAGDGTFKEVCIFPWRVAGMGFSTMLGVPLGAVRDGVRTSTKATNMVGGKVGKEGDPVPTTVGAMTGGPVGFMGGGAYGMVDGAFHGAKNGYKHPFTKESMTFKDE